MANKGLLVYPLRRVIGEMRTTGTLMDPSHTILRLECGHRVDAPNRKNEHKFARCEECPKREEVK